MAYKKVGWKDYPSTDTPINATNLDHMDAGILENAQTIGDKTKISGIGDGTVAGAIAANSLSLDNCLKSVSDGKSTVASAITAQGVSTAADAEFATIAANIATAGNARYNKGVTDADNRVNTASTNYKSGYNAGKSAGVSSGCCIAGWRSTAAYSNGQWVPGWTGVNPNFFTVNSAGIIPVKNFTATVYWQGYNKRDIDFFSNGAMGHRDNGTSLDGVRMNFYAGTQCGFKTNDSGGGSLGAAFIVLN